MDKLLIANFKMNGNKQFYLAVNKNFNKIKLQDTKVILCPPFVYLPFFKIKNKKVFLSSQDISNAKNNKATGQISAEMLKEFGVKYCIIGHKELRDAGDNIDVIRQKIYNAITNNIQPIICVGLNKNEDLNKLKFEVEALLENQPKFEPIFAYEPIWTIGNNSLPSVKEINTATEIIKSACHNLKYTALVVYGGSINLNNFNKVKNAKVDGFMFGKITADLKQIIELIKGVENE